MRLELDFQSRVPIYLQIVDQVKNLARAGVLRPGDQLPTVREVAAELRVNFNTVARAYRLLHEERVISTQQGRGTYALEFPGDGEPEAARAALLSRLVEGWQAEARRLGFTLEEVEDRWLGRLAEEHTGCECRGQGER